MKYISDNAHITITKSGRKGPVNKKNGNSKTIVHRKFK